MRRPKSRRTEGFTLPELMVAMIAGAFTVLSVYYVSAASSRHFFTQQRVAQVQQSVRLAFAQLRRDVARAGFLGTANTARERTCLNPLQPIQAIEYDADTGDHDQLPFDDENVVRSDVLRLTGSFSSNDRYLAVGTNAAGTTIFLQQQWQAFRRSFGLVNLGDPVNPDAFEEVFTQNRYLRIRSREGWLFFPRITAVNPADASITFTPALPIGTGCPGGLADGAEVSVIERIQWSVQSAPPGSVGRLGLGAGAAQAALGTVPAYLVRQELEFGGANTPFTDSERYVLEFAASFEIDIVWDERIAADAPPVLNGPATPGDSETNSGIIPHMARSVIATISARTPEQDPYFPFIARADFTEPLTRYRTIDPTNSDIVGAARVRTERGEIFLRNLAASNLF